MLAYEVMDFGFILNDVSQIMDAPLQNPANQSHSNNKSANQSHGNDPRDLKLPSDWSNPLSPSETSSNIDEETNEDLFPWANNIKFEFEKNENNNNGEGGGNDSVVASAGMKRKFCEDVDEGPPLVKMQSTGESQGLTFLDQNDHVVIAESMLGVSQHSKMAANMAAYKNPTRESMEDQEQKTALKATDAGSAASKMSTWQVDEIADNLAADLDGSLSGLGVDLSTASYNMSEALLALPSLTVFKQEAPSPSSLNDNGPLRSSAGIHQDGDLVKSKRNRGSHLHQLLQQHTPSGYSGNVLPQQASGEAMVPATATLTSTHPALSEGYQHCNTSNSVLTTTATNSLGIQQDINIDCRFQYVLAAATSIATKVNEETLTYLNQGQSYEIKLKKLGELSAYRGKILKSVIRICFHERRLQYTEREQMSAWQASRPGERILEVDVPLSYGLFEVSQDPALLNTVGFLWDPTKEVGVYIKVNCISTEFTPKKHGGEKGVPFRIQVETYLQGDSGLKRLHAAACQIKVFKLKGADRKHKQDREKILKRPLIEQEKYQPSYDCTVLSDIQSDTVLLSSVVSAGSANATAAGYSSGDSNGTNQSRANGTSSNNANVNPVSIKDERNPSAVQPLPVLPTPVVTPGLQEQVTLSSMQEVPLYQHPLATDASAQQTSQWLQTNRFSSHLRTFASFSGADILRLSRDDIIQICGLADGIRLFNALHSKAIVPRLTLYLCLEPGAPYHALYLSTLTSAEVATKLAALLGVSVRRIHDVFVEGPSGIRVCVSDDVVGNIRDESTFTVEVLQDHSGERYRLLLKPANP